MRRTEKFPSMRNKQREETYQERVDLVGVGQATLIQNDPLVPLGGGLGRQDRSLLLSEQLLED